MSAIPTKGSRDERGKSGWMMDIIRQPPPTTIERNKSTVMRHMNVLPALESDAGISIMQRLCHQS